MKRTLIALALAALLPLGYRGMAITVPYKVAVIPLLQWNSSAMQIA